MVKATLRSAVLLGLLAWSAPSFAEVQNVKVGGDVTVRGVVQSNMDLNHGELVDDDQTNILMSTTGLNVGADLTENVSAFIRLANERDWGSNNTTANGDFDISQAWVRFKELFYSPLTVTIGTQPLRWGRGLVLGSNLYPSVLSTGSFAGGDRNGSIAADQFTDFTAFDAIKVDLDLAGVAPASLPVNVQYVYTKLDENTAGLNDDVNLQGVNIGAHFDSMNSEVEMYYLNKRDRSTVNSGAGVAEVNSGSISTWGLRGSTQPVEGAYLYSEIALQHGPKGAEIDGGGLVAPTGASGQAWLFNLGAEYTLKDVATTPKIGAEWLFYSGHDKDNANQGWDPIAPGYFTTLIRQYQTRNGIVGLYPVDQTGVTSSFTNQSQISVYGGLKPIEDLSVDSRLSWFTLEDGALVQDVSSQSRHSFLGTEWDTSLGYNYTDDVQFGLSYGIFFPGSVFRESHTPGGASNTGRNTAQQLVSTVSVKF